MTTVDLETQDDLSPTEEGYLTFAGAERQSYQAVIEHVDHISKLEHEIKTNLKLTTSQLNSYLNEIWTNYESVFEHLTEIIRFCLDPLKKEFLTTQYNCHKERYKTIREELKKAIKLKKMMEDSYDITPYLFPITPTKAPGANPLIPLPQPSLTIS